jgi:two-component system, chemotaxis family, protein-glutamate methylesterase/glutaminase
LWRNIDAAVIGASAGGVEVLSLLLPRLPAACNAGLAAVRLAGGRTVVQDPHCAAVPILPEAALSRGPADFLLLLEQLQELFASCPAGG